MCASWSAVTRLVAAGPEVTRQTPTFPVILGVPLGRVAGRRLLADQDVTERPREVVERIVEGAGRRRRASPNTTSTPSRLSDSSTIRAPDIFIDRSPGSSGRYPRSTPAVVPDRSPRRHP